VGSVFVYQMGCILFVTLLPSSGDITWRVYLLWNVLHKSKDIVKGNFAWLYLG
jgi:hypothetical protein